MCLEKGYSFFKISKGDFTFIREIRIRFFWHCDISQLFEYRGDCIMRWSISLSVFFHQPQNSNLAIGNSTYFLFYFS